MWMKLFIRFAGVLLVALLIAAIYFAGRQMGSTSSELSCEIDKRETIERAIEKVNNIASENGKVAAAHVDTVDHLETVYKNIKEQTNAYLQSHPVNNGCDIGTDGVLLWNTANTAATQPGR